MIQVHFKRRYLAAAAILAMLSVAQRTLAHHSYSMFDQSKRAKVSGTVAKVEWNNPHVFVWLYVKNEKGAFDLYGIENGSISLLTRYGWSKSTMKVGEKIDVEYFRLKDGRNGGYFIRATHADGTVTNGDPYAPGGALLPAGLPK